MTAPLTPSDLSDERLPIYEATIRATARREQVKALDQAALAWASKVIDRIKWGAVLFFVAVALFTVCLLLLAGAGA